MATNDMGITNYAASFWVFGHPGQSIPNKWIGAAKLSSHFKDGTSKTILFTERYASSHLKPANPTATDPERIGGGLWAFPPHFPEEASSSTLRFQYAGMFGMDYKGTKATQDFAVQPAAANPFRATSPHIGGINIAMGDGSTRFIGTNVFAKVANTTYNSWHAAITPDGGDLLGPEWTD